MKRGRLSWKLYVIAAPLLILIAAALYVYWPISPNLSAYADLGAKYDVRILRDSWGVPHVFGKTDPDAAFGLAYAHSEDDFLTIQQTLLAARGKLATAYGQSAGANDYMVQLLRIWDVVNAKYESDLASDTRAVMEAYADGLNYYAAKHPGSVLTPDLFPLSGKDIAAASVHKSPLFFDLDKTLAELFSDPQNPDATPTAVSFYSDYDTSYGSNTFAVSPIRSADGSTFLAVNSHQPWEGPVTWYEAHVHSDQGWDMVGALFPATPAIVHGHNQNLGWAFTVNKADLTDVYVLEMNPDNSNQYRFDGQWKDLEVRQAPITVKLLGNFRWTVYKEALWSVYGPVVRQPHGVYAIRYAGYGRVDIFQQLYRMNKAANFEEWRQAMKDGGLPTFNVGYADKEGNIYYLYNAMIPIRKEGYDWSKYLPGNTSETLWTEYLPFDQLPQVLNPASGFIQNTNSTPFQTTTGEGNPDPADYSSTLGIDTRVGNRMLRALAMYGGDPSITFDEFKAYKFDQAYAPESDISKMVQMLTQAAFPADIDERAALEILNKWDFQANAESLGTTIAIYTLNNLIEAKQPVKGGQLVGGKIDPQALQDAFRKTVKSLKEKFGQVNVPWSQVNRLIRGATDLGLGGGPDVLNAVYGSLQPDGRFKGYQGDSYVLLVDWDKNGQVHSESIHQYGSATLDQNSPHYADQAKLFVNRQLKPVWFTEADIKAHLEQEYRP